MENTQKLTFSEWFENIWYHYKWMIIICTVLAVFLLVSLVQFLSNDEPDVDILHVGPMYINATAVDQIEDSLRLLAEDTNGDGEVNVNVLDITVNKFGTDKEQAQNYDHNNSGLQRFQTEIRAGDAVIYFLDEEFFNICLDEGLLTPLDEVLDDADMPDEVIEGCGVKLSSLDAYSLDGLSSIPSTAILCLRRSPEKDALKYGRTQEIWQGNRDAFVNIIKYRNEE